METKDFPIPSNIDEIKGLFAQFEAFIPPDKRQIIWDTLQDLEANGGIRDEAHGRALLGNLLAVLGMGEMA